MTPKRRRLAEHLLQRALKLQPAERAAFVAQVEPDVRAELQALLAQEEPSDVTQTVSLDAVTMRPVARSQTETYVFPKQLGHYQIVEMIGKGGMGVVFHAHDPRLGREVAIKTLPVHYATSGNWLARFRREARLLASLSHPNVAVLYSLEESPHTSDDQTGIAYYLVMELVQGETLADKLKRDGALPLAEVLDIAGQVAAGLEAAHRKSITHRDIKPSNIKVDWAGCVKVLDFGLAKETPRDASDDNAELTDLTTQIGKVIGTLGYMSPEQMRGRGVDHRADVWAFGCLTYELLTGHKAFDLLRSPGNRMDQVLHGEPDWSVLPAETPVQVRELLVQCLHKASKDRPDDMGRVRKVLEKARRQFDGET